MVNEAAVQELNRRIVEGWLQVLPEGLWTASYLFYGPAGKAVYADTTALDRDGHEHSLSQPHAVYAALDELRAEMSDPERGAWISAELKLTDALVLETTFNWDRRFYWGTHAGNPWMPSDDAEEPTRPSDDDFLDELERFPRSPLFLPAWYPRHRVVEGETLDDAAFETREADVLEPARTARVALPDEVKPLQDAWGWPGMFETINDGVLGNLEQRSDDEVAAILGAEGVEEQHEALLDLVDDAVDSALLVLDRSPALVAVRLLRERLALTGGTEPGGLQRLNLGEAFGAILNGSDGELGALARPVRDELGEVFRLVAASNVAQRFPA